MADIGYAALLLALVLAVYASVAAWMGERRRVFQMVLSARNSALMVAGLLTLVVAIELYLLTSGDFRTLYVAQVTNRAMPVFFKLTALWGGQAGRAKLLAGGWR